jgi:hypothetical protein
MRIKKKFKSNRCQTKKCLLTTEKDAVASCKITIVRINERIPLYVINQSATGFYLMGKNTSISWSSIFIQQF